MKIDISNVNCIEKRKYIKAIQIIGADIQIYGHFDPFDIVDENSEVIDDITNIYEFLNCVYNFYHNKKLYNPRYGNDLQRQNDIKDVIKSSIDDQSYTIGMQWIDSQ